MKAELVPENGDPPIPILKDLTVVGRRDFCDVTIDDPSLSKRHCVLVKTDGLLVARDLATTNGTKVKGQRVRWAALLPDDRIAFGSYKLRVYLGPDDAPAPSEMAKWNGGVGKGKGNAAAASPPPAPAIAAPSPAPESFSAPSPLGTPAVVAGEYWDAVEDDEAPDADESKWQDLMLRRPDQDDVIIELD